jgi:hypothetical protein
MSTKPYKLLGADSAISGQGEEEPVKAIKANKYCTGKMKCFKMKHKMSSMRKKDLSNTCKSISTLFQLEAQIQILGATQHVTCR